MAKAYGVWVDDYGVSARALVMVGPDGTVEWSYRSPSPLEIPGANLIFDALEAVSAPSPGESGASGASGVPSARP